MKIKWVTPEEYARFRKELEEKTVRPSGVLNLEMGFLELYDWCEVTRQQVLVRVADTGLLRELM